MEIIPPTSTPESTFLTVAQAAERMGRSEKFVRLLCKKGELPGAVQTYERGPWCIPTTSVSGWITSASKPNQPGQGAHVDGNVNTGGGDFIGRDQYGYTAQQVSVLLTQIRTTFQPKLFDGGCPYVGLAAFDEQDADRFFGRERLVAELLTRVKEARFVVVAGPSGSGKSSLVRAGLLHQLKQGALPGSDRWLYESLKPGRNPLDELARVAASLASTLNAGDDIHTKGTTDPTLFHRWVEIALKDDRSGRAILLVDQFEETFTQVANKAERVAFLNLLTYAATVVQGRVTVLFTLRSDFVSNCATYPSLNTLLNQQFMQVGAMQPDELVSAIALPALQVGLQIDPDLIAQIVNDMRDEPGALPLMQFALKDLFDVQQAKGGVIALTLAEYLARGGIRKALERHADHELARLSEPEQSLARAIFTHLIQVGLGMQATRRTATFDEVVPAGIEVATVQTVVQKLADAQLVTTDERGEQDTLTLAHERLIEAWPWLQRLVIENRDAIALQSQINEDAATWEANQRDPSYLYTGARLATVEEQLAEKKLALSELAQAFVAAGIAARETTQRRRRQTLQVVIGGLAAAVIIFAGLTSFALIKSEQAAQQARRAKAGELAASAQSELAQSIPDHSLALLLAIQAITSTQPEDGLVFASANAALDAAIQNAPPRHMSLAGHRGRILSAAFSADGEHIVTASEDGTARVWEVASGQLIHTLTGHRGRILSAAFSADGKHIVTASEDGTAHVWEVASGQPVHILTGHEDWVYSAGFSADGKYIVTASADGTARVWEVASGQPVRILIGHKGGVLESAFSADGKYIVTASSDRTARTWFTHLDASVEAAKRLIQRDPPDFTLEERQRFGLD